MPISSKTLDFLFENKLNNSKEWFHSHKEQYNEYVIEPLAELVILLEPVVKQIDPNIIVDPRPTKSISRIYRDTRFSKDKSLYRDNMWLIFIREKQLYNGLPAYYVDLSANGLEYGVGYYQPSTDSLRSYRELILNREPAFLEAFKAMKELKEFTMYGDLYKRSKAPDEPEEIRNWLDRKAIGMNTLCTDFDLIFSGELYEFLSKQFLKLKPLYDFYIAVEARRFRKDQLQE